MPNESEDLLAGAIGAFVWGIGRTGRPAFLMPVACYLHPPRKCLFFSLLRRFHRAITFQDVYNGMLAFDAIGREEFLNEVLPLTRCCIGRLDVRDQLLLHAEGDRYRRSEHRSQRERGWGRPVVSGGTGVSANLSYQIATGQAGSRRAGALRRRGRGSVGALFSEMRDSCAVTKDLIAVRTAQKRNFSTKTVDLKGVSKSRAGGGGGEGRPNVRTKRAASLASRSRE